MALKLSIWREWVPHPGKAAMRRTVRSRNPLERQAEEPVSQKLAAPATVCQWVLVHVVRPYRRIYASLYVMSAAVSAYSHHRRSHKLSEITLVSVNAMTMDARLWINDAEGVLTTTALSVNDFRHESLLHRKSKSMNEGCGLRDCLRCGTKKVPTCVTSSWTYWWL